MYLLPQLPGGRDRRISGICLSASLTQSVSSMFSKRLCLKKKKKGGKKLRKTLDVDLWPQHTCTHMYTHAHPSHAHTTHTYSYITHRHRHMHIHMHTHMHKHMHICTQKSTHIYEPHHAHIQHISVNCLTMLTVWTGDSIDIIVGFSCPLDTSVESCGKMGLQLKNFHTQTGPRHVYQSFSLLLLINETQAYCGQCQLQTGSPGWHKEVDGASHGEQAGKQHLATVSASFSASRFVTWAPDSPSLDDGIVSCTL